MKIAAVQTARAGSKSVLNKNILEINNKPLYLHNIDAAKKSKYINDIYVNTDCPVIKAYAKELNYEIIERPDNLRGDDASHHDVIKHSLFSIEQNLATKIDILVVLLGNAMGATRKDLDNAIEILISNKEYHSVQSVSELNMFNPFRALKIKDNKITTIIPQEDIMSHAKLININDKKSCGNVYFFNGSFWVIRRKHILEHGMLPFPWLGTMIYPYVQQPVFELDAEWQIKLLG
jgi:N-acylneuraminate cytidylyltransferase